MAPSYTVNHCGLYVGGFLMLLCLIAEHGCHPSSHPNFRTPKPVQPPCNTTECLKLKKELKQLHRIHMIQQYISSALNRTKHTQTPTRVKNVSEPTANTTNHSHKSIKPNFIRTYLPSIGTKHRNILKFNVRPDKGHTKVVTAQLLVVIKRKLGKRSKQKHKSRQKRRGKRITIKVHEVNSTSGEERLLQTLKKRVKKTYLQNIKLPAEVLQRYVDMDQSNVRTDKNILQLKVTCQRCGKKIRPFLANRSNRKKQLRSLKDRYHVKPLIALDHYTT
ncbi:Hypothetical predicted protein [Octopus vulgaris]|uniref:Uncharacterized protein n=1 Tax=Octopus vulgaris TaxID=6645 RepID=A0AA36BXL6_OCTVU|nr:Hypothetical predicted protein [Octopus vulgaris]